MKKIAMARNRFTPGSIFAALLLFLAAVPIRAARAQKTDDDFHPPPNVSQLIQGLKSPDLQHRRDAARQLMMIEPLPPEAIQALAEALKTAEPNGAVQRYAITAPTKAGTRAVPALTALTRSKNPQTCGAAVQALGRMAISDPAVWPILIGIFKENFDPWGVARQLAKVGPPVVPLLRKALKDNDPRIRAGAAAALAQMGSLAQTYRHSVPSVRRQAGIVFADTADLVPAAPELSEALKDPDSNVRYQAAIALAYADPSDRRAVPILVNLLEDKDFILHDAAIAALENMGSGAKDAVPGLERALASNPDWAVRVGAARALALSGGVKACGPLARAIADDKDGNVRAAAGRAIGELWPACPQTIPALMGTLGNKRYSATDELAKLGRPAVPALTAALKNPDLYVREDAVQALAQMKPLSPEAVDALMLALKDKSLDARSAAATALQDVGGEAERAALAEQKREEQIYAEQSKPDTRRYTKKELIAPIPADEDHKYPLTLAYLFPICPIGGSTQQAEFLITLHSGKDRPERLVFWKKVGDDQYQQVKVIEPEGPDFAEQHFETPKTFAAKVRVVWYGRQYDETELFVDVPLDGWRSHTDQVFAVDGGELHPVDFESAREWYKDKLGPRESVQYPASNSFSNGKLEFAFAIWNADDPMCCPTAGQVIGTYKIIKETGFVGPPPAFGWSPGQPIPPRIVNPMRKPPTPVTTWRMVVDTAKREPMAGPVKPSKKPGTTPKSG